MNRDVRLIIRAKDETSRVFRQIAAELKKVEAATKALRTMPSRASYAGLEKSLANLNKAASPERMKALRDAVSQSRAALSRTSSAAKDAAASLRSLREEYARTEREAADLERRLAKVREAMAATQARRQATRAPLRDTTRELRSVEAAIRRAKAAQDKLPASIEKSRERLARLNEQWRQLKRTIAQAERSGQAGPRLDNLRARQDRLGERRAAELTRLRSRQASLLNAQRYLPGYEEEAARLRRELGKLRAQSTRAANRLAKLSKEEEILARQAKDARRHLERLPASIKKQEQALAQAARAAREAGAEHAQFARRAEQAQKKVAAATEQAAQAERGYVESLRRRMAAETARDLRQQREELQRTKAAWRAIEDQIRKTAQAMRAQGASRAQIEQATAALRRQAGEAKQAFRIQQQSLADFARQRRLLVRAPDIQGLDRVRAALRQIKEDARQSMRAFRQAFRGGFRADLARPVYGTAKAFQRLTTAVQGYTGAARAAKPPTSLLRNALRAMGVETRAAITVFQRMRYQVLSLIAAYTGFYGVYNGIARVAEAQQQMDLALNRMASVTDGNMRAARVELEHVLQVSRRLGLVFGDMAREYTKFALATKGTALEGADTRRIFENMAVAARVAGLSQEQVKLSFVALSQIASKGVVQMEELRRQLGDHIPGAVKIMARALGYGEENIKAFYDAVRKGEVGAEALLPFSEELRRVYEGQLPQALDTVAAAVGRFKNEVFLALKGISEAGASRGITELLDSLTNTLRSSDAQAAMRSLAQGIRGLLNLLATLAEHWRALGTAVTLALSVSAGRKLFRLYRFLRNGAADTLRASVTFRLLSRSVQRFRSVAAATGSTVRALAAASAVLPGPFKALLVVLPGVVTWLFRMATAATSVDKAVSAHDSIMSRVFVAYSDAGQKVSAFVMELQKLSKASVEENIRAQERALKTLEAQLDSTTRKVRSFWDAVIKGTARDVGILLSFDPGKIWERFGIGTAGRRLREAEDTAKVRSSVQALVAELKSGKKSVDSFNTALDKLLEERPAAKEYIERVREAGKAYADQVRRVREANAVLEARKGNVDDARLAELGLEDSTRRAKIQTQQFASAMRALNNVLGGATDTMSEQETAADGVASAMQRLEAAYRRAAAAASSLEERQAALRAYEAQAAQLRRLQVLSPFSPAAPAPAPAPAPSVGLSTAAANELAKELVVPISTAAVKLVKEFEGLRLKTYTDSAGVATVGYGYTNRAGGPWRVRPGQTISRQQAEQMLTWTLNKFGQEVVASLGPAAKRLNPNQLGALTAFAFNIGMGNFNKSSARRAVLEGRLADVPRLMRLYSKARDPNTGRLRYLRGLERRRIAEGRLFNTPYSGPAAPQMKSAEVAAVTAEQQRLLASFSETERKVFDVLRAQGKLTGPLREQVKLVKQYSGLMGDAEKNEFNRLHKALTEQQRAEKSRAKAAADEQRNIEQRLARARLERDLAKEDLLTRKTRLALIEAEQRAQRKGYTLTEAQRQQIRETVRLQYEQQAAAEKAAEAQRQASIAVEAHEARLAQLLQQRKNLVESLQQAALAGDNAGVVDYGQKIEAINAEIAAEQQKLAAAERRAALAQLEAEARSRGREVDDREREAVLARLELKRQEREEQNQLNIAKEQAAAMEERITLLQQQRQALVDQYKVAEENGDAGRMAMLQQQIEAINIALQQAAAQAMAFHQNLGGPAADASIAKLQALSAEAGNFQVQGQRSEFSWKRVGDLFANGLTNAFDNFAKAVANGENVWDAARKAFLQFAADFLRQIAQMIIKQAIFNMLSGFGGGGATGGGGFLGGLFGHTGGIVYGHGIGTGNPVRRLPATVWAMAPRFHTGGMVGLAPNEVPAILQKGEEVLARDDPRHTLNGGGQPPSVDVKVVNALDAGDFVSEGLDTPHGQQAILNFIRSNPDAVKQALGS